jgi:hypothetical protein
MPRAGRFALGAARRTENTHPHNRRKAMPKKTSTKGTTRQRKAGRKLLDLPVKTRKDRDADAVRGGSDNAGATDEHRRLKS